VLPALGVESFALPVERQDASELAMTP